MSEIKVNSVVNSTGDNDSGLDLSTNDQVIIKTANTTAVTVDANQNLGIGTSPASNRALHVSSTAQKHARFERTGSATSQIEFSDSTTTNQPSLGSVGDNLTFETANTERARVDSSGNLLVGKTASNSDNAGFEANATGFTSATRSDGLVFVMDRLTSHGDIIQFRKDNTIVGSIGGNSNYLYIGSPVLTGAFIGLGNNYIYPSDSTGGFRDNAIDLGVGASRFDDIFATNGTIQTSDQQEKNTITDSDLGLDFIKRLTPKSYIFNGKTRTHYGLIAQDVETVLGDISKSTSEFAGFIKDDISEEQDGSEYRYGLRYTEFVAPLIQAVKDQQAIIEDLQARITALENAE